MYFNIRPARNYVKQEYRKYSGEVAIRTIRCDQLPRNDPRYIDSSPGYQSVTVAQCLGFELSHEYEWEYNEGCPSKEEYFKSTGLRRLLLAELLHDNAGLFTSQKRKRLLPFESRSNKISGRYCTSASEVADFVDSIGGDDYGPTLDWLPVPLQKYGVWEDPSVFLNDSSHECYVTFETAPISRGSYGKTYLYMWKCQNPSKEKVISLLISS